MKKDDIKTLRDGTREALPLVATTIMVLERLYETEPLALYDLRMMCDDRGYQPFGENGDVLKDARLLEPDGRMHSSVRNIVRNAVTVKDLSIGLRNPLKQEEVAP